MASRMAMPQLRHSVLTVAGTMVLTAAITGPLHAEEAQRKSIYDDIPPPQSQQPTTQLPSATNPTVGHLTSNSPTIRLSHHIRTARLAAHEQLTTAQARLDTLFDKFISTEHSLTSTVASVAPAQESNEQLIPGTLFVAVATMAGAIVSRRRMFLIRGLTPLATGIAASWYFLPETTRNMADLAWKYEQKLPEVANAHLKTREVLEDAWHMVEGSTREGRRVVEDSVAKARTTVEEWVRKQ